MPAPSILTLIIAGIAILAGLIDILVTIVFTRKNRPGNIVIGVAIILLGASTIWLSLDDNAFKHKMIAAANNLSGLLLLLFVFGLFVLKSIMNIRDGHRQLNKPDLPQFFVWRGAFQIISGVIMIVFIIFALLLFFLQNVR
jgi:hypothetical protein